MTERRHLVLTPEKHMTLVSVVRAAVEADPANDELRKLFAVVKAAKKVVPGKTMGLAQS